MIRQVTVPALECTCGICGHVWHSLAPPSRPPLWCANSLCRSREWDGSKVRRKPRRPARAPAVVLPRPQKVRGIEAEL